MRLKATKFKACRWNVRRTLTLFSVETAWDDLALHARSASWNTHGAVGVSIGTNWNDRQRTTSVRRGEWLKCIKLVRYAWTNYHVKRVRTFNRWSVWTVRTPGPILSSSVRYAGYVTAGRAAPLSWHTARTVGAIAAASWRAAENPCVVTAGWRLFALAGRSVDAGWSVAAPAGLSAGACWDTDQPHAKLKTGWSVAAPVSAQAAVAFNTRATTAAARSSEWNIYLTLWMARSTRYKAFTSLIFVYTPSRTPVYPNEVKGGFLSPMTANQLGRKQKLKLGIK